MDDAFFAAAESFGTFSVTFKGGAFIRWEFFAFLHNSFCLMSFFGSFWWKIRTSSNVAEYSGFRQTRKRMQCFEILWRTWNCRGMLHCGQKQCSGLFLKLWQLQNDPHSNIQKLKREKTCTPRKKIKSSAFASWCPLLLCLDNVVLC